MMNNGFMSVNVRGRSEDRRSAFTLIELLVVIAIIGLLIALLVPSLGRAREASRRVACAAQMRQVSAMLMAYAADNRGGFYSSGNSGIPRALYWWNGQLVSGGYVTQEERHLLRCPFHPPYETEPGWALGNWQWWTYGSRANTTGNTNNVLRIQFSALRNPTNHPDGPIATDPSSYWILADSGGGHSANWPEGSQTFRLYDAHMYSSGFNDGGGSGFNLRHDGMANVSFADGHVSSHGRASLVAWGIKGHVDQYGNRITH